MDPVYLIGNCNFVECYGHYTLNLFVEEIIKEEFKEVQYHYSIDEILEYHLSFFESLEPYYIKYLITTLPVENDKYQYEEDEIITIRPLIEDDILKYI